MVALLLVALFLAVFAGSAAAQGEAPSAAAEGTVYVMTNDATGNAVLAFARAVDGTLSPADSYSTGGEGTGAGLGSQSALIRSEDGRYLFVVNAGSDEITSFRIRQGALVLADTVSSNGDMPISLAFSGRKLVVLNGGGSGNLSAFVVTPSGRLRLLADSTQPLSNGGVGPAPGPAQVSFTPNRRQLVVTEKASNLVLTYDMTVDGIQPPVMHVSAGQTPFGFAFGNRNILIVSEAFGGAANGSALSSYRVGVDTVETITPSAATHQTAACWVVVTGNGKYVYTTNAGSAAVTGYAVARDGSLTLLDADGHTATTGTGAADAALSRNSQYLYVLNTGSDTISAYAVGSDGSLTSLGETPVPATTIGIAAR
jgi:hypothetical protein